MHKKLLLVMLVPILALSLIVVGCGGDDDDDGMFEGDPTHRTIQGAWQNLWDGSGERPNYEFFILPNQFTLVDLAEDAGGRSFRVGFREIALEEIRNVLPAEIAGVEMQGISHARFREVMGRMLLAMHDPEYVAGVSGMTLVPTVGGTILGFQVGANPTASIAGLHGTLFSWSAGLGGHLAPDWPTLNNLHSQLVANIGYREIERFFRAQLGINFHARFAEPRNMLLGMATTVAGVRDSELHSMGFTPSILGTVPGASPLITSIAGDQPNIIVPFEWTLYHWDTSAFEGSLHGIFVCPTGNVSEQFIVILGTRNPVFWQTQMPIPVGVYTRGTSLQ